MWRLHAKTNYNQSVRSKRLDWEGALLLNVLIGVKGELNKKSFQCSESSKTGTVNLD